MNIFKKNLIGQRRDTMGYAIDLGTIEIKQYKEKLKNKNLVPSRMILKKKIEERFAHFIEIGVETASDLFGLLKKKGRIEELSKLNNFTEEYLTILLRELNSIQAKPRKLKQFEWISDDTIKKLEKEGIKNTQQLYELVLTRKSRKDLADKLCMNENELLELTKQTDLSRIQWVNPTFARVLYEAGYDTIQKVQKANYENLYKKIIEINEKRNLYKGSIGLNDMKICIEAAKEVIPEVEY